MKTSVGFIRKQFANLKMMKRECVSIELKTYKKAFNGINRMIFRHLLLAFNC